MNVLVLTEDSNSKTVKIVNKCKLVPLVCNTVLSASDLIKHHSISVIIIDTHHKNVDSLEFILNAREMKSDAPIFIVESKANENVIDKISAAQLKAESIKEEWLFEKLQNVKNTINKINIKTNKEAAQILEIDYKIEPYAVLNLSSNNTSLKSIEFNKTNAFQNYVDGEIEKAGAKFAVGRYGEDRIIYSLSNVFKDDERRSVHLGLDLWTAPGIKVYTPFDAVVHSFGNNNNSGDYGPTIILKHQSSGREFYTLYGHLSLASLDGITAGEQLNRGDLIGRIGSSNENGNWPPHLHFQIINDILHYKGDFPGVCKPSERNKFLRLCPNPNKILKIPGLD